MILSASRRLLVLDHFRIPYAVHPSSGTPRLEHVGTTQGAGTFWPARSVGRSDVYRLADIPLYCRVLDDDSADSLLGRTGRRWSRVTPIAHRSGQEVSSVRIADDGSAFLPFDPDEAVSTLLSEAYVAPLAGGARSKATAVARTAYYRLRPLLPRFGQMALRRRFARIQERAAFPRWPVETALHDLQAFLLGLVDEVTGEAVPRLGPWPAGRRWALSLTHDVETRSGYRHVEALAQAERRRGLRSAWFLVPERDYVVDDALVRALTHDGFEVGVHGLRHDGRDLSPGTFERRLPSIRQWADRWGATGFRSPATHRSWELMPRLGFDYDTSYSDVARYEPQPGGCCSWLPFFIDGTVELPITLPMDHTLFELLEHRDGAAWHEKAAFLRERGGMALMLTHPDYLLSAERLVAYEEFLDEYSADETVWQALPREVSAWWRRRAASTIERDERGWRVVGPAAGEARIETGPLR